VTHLVVETFIAAPPDVVFDLARQKGEGSVIARLSRVLPEAKDYLADAQRENISARGLSGTQTPGGGATAGILSGLYGAKASDASNAINTINLQNSQQALNNQFNAASVLSGNAQTMGQNNAVFGSGASNVLNQYVQAANQGFGNAFTKGLGGALGAGIGGAVTGGISGGLGTAMSTIGSGNYGW